ncbi:zinc ribbon domain-containing protein [Solidesulfovibrio magneticus]|uniref:Zinc-ribbon domain-containing protein n=1 Tax=Solidesulfovibrio magneticus (strain ATCC 700980 / DSM 13731 / RS-1) TaxID=573370 RepID=C4XTL9_SOLM1|nr:zinc ribbon domain-containing protein [Solidesulfovibrio magneticus]BAH73536.1 hypothetical protein DMR_00450 [Solidesulfovibrio magneticus RS-1]
MRCNKCGGDNPDDRRFCQVCGHKLQSGRAGADDTAALEPGAQDGDRATGRPASADGEARGDTAAWTPGLDAGEGRPRPQKPELAPDKASPDARPDSRLLDFQGWKNPLFGLGPYFEACLYAGVLAVAVVVCLAVGVLWPLYPLLAVLALIAWLRRL